MMDWTSISICENDLQWRVPAAETWKTAMSVRKRYNSFFCLLVPRLITCSANRSDEIRLNCFWFTVDRLMPSMISLFRSQLPYTIAKYHKWYSAIITIWRWPSCDLVKLIGDEPWNPLNGGQMQYLPRFRIWRGYLVRRRGTRIRHVYEYDGCCTDTTITESMMYRW